MFGISEKPDMKKDNKIKKIVKQHYGKIAAEGGCCNSCGCGSPLGLGEIKEGEVVLDLWSGAGFDCFLAAKKVGDSGRVIGVDMPLESLKVEARK